MEQREILYICGKCGHEVAKDATECSHCHAKLGNIKCPYCHFTGSPEDFKNDRCPRCGRRKIDYNKGTTRKANAVQEESTETEGWLSRYFVPLFLVLLAVIGGLLVVFLKHFNFV